jgi:hypothetical protein
LHALMESNMHIGVGDGDAKVDEGEQLGTFMLGQGGSSHGHPQH